MSDMPTPQRAPLPAEIGAAFQKIQTLLHLGLPGRLILNDARALAQGRDAEVRAAMIDKLREYGLAGSEGTLLPGAAHVLLHNLMGEGADMELVWVEGSTDVAGPVTAMHFGRTKFEM